MTIKAQEEVDRWNREHDVGTRVHYWKGVRRDDRPRSGEALTRSPAQVLPGPAAVVWLEGVPACIALSHIEPVSIDTDWTPLPVCPTCGAEDEEWHEGLSSDIGDGSTWDLKCGDCGATYVVTMCLETTFSTVIKPGKATE